MNENPIPIIVRILDKEYRVGCQSGEQENLLASAHYLDRKMREIRDAGKVIGSDRIAVMAALNIVNELLEQKLEKDHSAQIINTRVRDMLHKIEIALDKKNQLDI